LSRVLNFNLENKNKKYRHNLEIVRDILLIASVKVKKTRIMYQANLSYTHMVKYLNSLLESGLIECDEDSCYFITKKGKEFLQKYNDYLERRKRIREEMKGADTDRLLLRNMCFNNEGNHRHITNKNVSCNCKTK